MAEKTVLHQPSSSVFDTDLARTLRQACRIVADACRQSPRAALLVLACVAVVGYFYGVVANFAINHSMSALVWMVQQWSSTKHGLEHGWVIPPLMLILLARQVPGIAALPRKPSAWGLVLVFLGALSYVVAMRTFQARVAIAGLPLIPIGAVMWLHGWEAAKRVIFPLILIYFVVPIPGMIQATNGLQLFATKSAYHIANIIGIPCTLSGNDIYSIPSEKWNFNIAEGCSGVRSLMALMLVSAVYAHLTQKQLWKKIVLFACSVPLAILGNCLRVASIVIVAEYISPTLAAKAYHEWSGFVFFLLVGLAGLALVDWLINRRKNNLVVRKVMPAPAAQPQSS